MDISQLKEPVIIAHRGFKKKFPENTLSAFDAAVKHGAVMIELDVSLSKDREIIVIHDDTLDRTTNGRGLVSDKTLTELRKLDAGSWFSEQFKNEKLPTLIEIFKRYANKIAINIEIKPEAFEVYEQNDSIEKQVIDLIGKYNCINSVIISSFEKRLIQRISKMENKPLLAFLSEEPADQNDIKFMKESDVYSWNPDNSILTPDQVSLMHDNGIKVFCYTVNDIDEGKKLFKMGVNGIFTDDIVSFI